MYMVGCYMANPTDFHALNFSFVVIYVILITRSLIVQFGICTEQELLPGWYYSVSY